MTFPQYFDPNVLFSVKNVDTKRSMLDITEQKKVLKERLKQGADSTRMCSSD